MNGVSWEIVAVVAVVAASVIWAVRGVWRATRQKKICTSCASSGGCPLADGQADRLLSSECVVPESLSPPPSG